MNNTVNRLECTLCMMKSKPKFLLDIEKTIKKELKKQDQLEKGETQESPPDGRFYIFKAGKTEINNTHLFPHLSLPSTLLSFHEFLFSSFILSLLAHPWTGSLLYLLVLFRLFLPSLIPSLALSLSLPSKPPFLPSFSLPRLAWPVLV